MFSLDNKWKDIDIQWWLYKGTLSRQPLNLRYYKSWFNAYKSYVELKDLEDSYEINEKIRNIISMLDTNMYEVESALSKDMFEVLKISINKIKDGLQEMT